VKCITQNVMTDFHKICEITTLRNREELFIFWKVKAGISGDGVGIIKLCDFGKISNA